MPTSKKRAWTLLRNSVNHRLVSFKPYSTLSGFNRDLRVLHLSHCAREWRPSWLLEMNHLDPSQLGETNRPDEYRGTCLRRDRLWALLLKLQG